MTRPEAIAIIRRVFNAWSRRKQANLRYHGQRNTPIACGKDARHFVSRKGFG